jgi:carboxymethylenebutenolidase
VYGFYAGNDARIGATVPATVDAMKAAGKKFEPVTYDGAGHGFMRAGEDPTNTVAGNKTAREQGFARLVSLLKTMKSAHAAGISSSGKVVSEKSASPVCHDDSKPTTMAAKL